MVLKPSYLLAVLLSLIHLGAVIIIIALSFPWFFILPLIILISISLVKNLYRYALRLSTNAIVEVWRKDNNEWILRTKQGEVIGAHLQENSYRSLYLVVLNFKRVDTDKKISVVILPDVLAKTAFRRLRAQLVM